jgi:exopolyphosphatase/guanosine-5'-triphosphate,3'-diphosphate pyrophosphatase
MKQLHGIKLRYVLTLHLATHGPATVTELTDLLG